MQIYFICYGDIVVIFACMLHWVIYLFRNKARNVANLHALVTHGMKICISKNFAT